MNNLNADTEASSSKLRGDAGKRISEFYDLPPSKWRPILGDGLHFHYGYWLDANKNSLEDGARATVAKLAEHIKPGSAVLDVGCGWGGPARQLIRDWGCLVQEITNSKVQAGYNQLSKLKVSLMDVEEEKINGYYDTILMLESMEHIFDKGRLLKKLRQCGDNLILSTATLDNKFKKPVKCYEGLIYLTSTDALLNDLEQSGWKVIEIDNRRELGIPSINHWKSRMEKTYQDDPPEPIRIWMENKVCEGLESLSDLVENVPLLDIIAV